MNHRQNELFIIASASPVNDDQTTENLNELFIYDLERKDIASTLKRSINKKNAPPPRGTRSCAIVPQVTTRACYGFSWTWQV